MKNERKQLHLPPLLLQEIELLAVTDGYRRSNKLYIELLELGLESYKNKKESNINHKSSK